MNISYNHSGKICIAAISLVEMISATIKTNVLFNVDATPALVEVKLEVLIYMRLYNLSFCVTRWCTQLPEILCTDEELNYTLFIENNHGEFVTKLGPIQHHFSYDAIIKQSIPLDGLDQNEIFFLSVQVDIPFLEFSSHKHQFSKIIIIVNIWKYYTSLGGKIIATLFRKLP